MRRVPSGTGGTAQRESSKGTRYHEAECPYAPFRRGSARSSLGWRRTVWDRCHEGRLKGGVATSVFTEAWTRHGPPGSPVLHVTGAVDHSLTLYYFSVATVHPSSPPSSSKTSCPSRHRSSLPGVPVSCTRFSVPSDPLS